MAKFLRKFTISDLIIISLMAGLGIALKPIIVPLSHLVGSFLFIPSGAFAGGFYMMWLVIGFGLTGKYGTGTLIGLVQALIVVLTGIVGSHGIMSLLSYTLPGLTMDLMLLIIGHRVCCRQCAFLAGAVANMTGTIVVNLIFFRLPGVFLFLTIFVALVSGGLGGLIAWQILVIMKKYNLVKNTNISRKNYKRAQKQKVHDLSAAKHSPK